MPQSGYGAATVRACCEYRMPCPYKSTSQYPLYNSESAIQPPPRTSSPE